MVYKAPKAPTALAVLPRSPWNRLVVLGAGLLALGLLSWFALLATPAKAAHSCPAGSLPTHFTPNANLALQVWDVEGKITAYDRVNRTITANGMTFTVPVGVDIKTIDLGQATGNISFAALTDPAAEAVRSIVGGTVIASGDTVFTTTATGACMSLVATSIFVELAENGLIGPLMSVDPVDGSFVVNGAIIRMNADPRFPGDLLDLGGNPITVADMVGYEGSLVTVGGYYDAAAGVLFGTLVETEVIATQPGTDTVIIERAESRASGELRVRGLVSRHPDTGLFAVLVIIHPGGLNATGAACEGPSVGIASIDPAAGSFDFRTFLGSVPSTVCVESTGGGVAARAVTVR